MNCCPAPRLAIALALWLVCAPAWPTDLIRPDGGPVARPKALKELPAGAVTRVRFDPGLFSDAAPVRFDFVAGPGRRWTLERDRSTRHANGSVSWIGRVAGRDARYRAVFTRGPRGALSGRVTTPDGRFRVLTRGRHTWLLDIAAAGLRAPPLGDDGMEHGMSYPAPVGAPAAGDSPAAPRRFGHVAGHTRIDVIVLYTPNVDGGSDPQGRIAQLIAVTNQAFADSGFNAVLNLVHAEQVSYSETATHSQALDDITPDGGVAAVFSGVEALRTQFGGDLVVLLRPFRSPEQGGCGRAWILGVSNGISQGQIVDSEKEFGYSVVAEGIDSGFICFDNSFAHEVGHNLGNKHQNETGGVFAYARGYDNNGAANFETIMSVASPNDRVDVFSNPNINCPPGSPSVPCGVAGSFDAVLSMNNALVKDVIAAFYDPPVSAVPGQQIVTRSTAAIRILKAEYGDNHDPPNASGTLFDDVGAADFAADWIEELAGASEQATDGCNQAGDLYCPSAALTKAAMAMMVWKAKNNPGAAPPGAQGNVFGDVPAGHPAAAFIEAMASQGWVQGCQPSAVPLPLFCPEEAMTSESLEAILDAVFAVPGP